MLPNKGSRNVTHTHTHPEVLTYQGLKTRTPVLTDTHVETWPKPQWKAPIETSAAGFWPR